jgi:hypothetical protein
VGALSVLWAQARWRLGQVQRCTGSGRIVLLVERRCMLWDLAPCLYLCADTSALSCDGQKAASLDTVGSVTALWLGLKDL